MRSNNRSVIINTIIKLTNQGVFMLGDVEYTINELFAQLGLDDSDEAIEAFIKSHQLPQEVSLKDADFWNEKQKMFLSEEWKKDAVWAMVIDDLNERLHKDAI